MGLTRQRQTKPMKRLTGIIGRVSKLGAVVCLIGLLSGCATNGLSVRENGRASYSHTLYQLARHQTPGVTPQPLRPPIRLAVAQVGEVAPPEHMLAQLRSYPDVIASVVAVPLPGAPSSPYLRAEREISPANDLQANAIGRLARTFGADEVLVLGGTIDTRTSRNLWAALDCTLVGVALFPSTHVHAEGKAAGALIEASSGAVRFQVETEQRERRTTPLAFEEQKTAALATEVRDTLASAVADKLVQRLRSH
jgi:hypothetical protein